jgi:hypothetical protein
MLNTPIYQEYRPRRQERKHALWLAIMLITTILCGSWLGSGTLFNQQPLDIAAEPTAIVSPDPQMLNQERQNVVTSFTQQSQTSDQ